MQYEKGTRCIITDVTARRVLVNLLRRMQDVNLRDVVPSLQFSSFIA